VFARRLTGDLAQREATLIALTDLTGGRSVTLEPGQGYPCGLKPLSNHCNREVCQTLPAGVPAADDLTDGWQFQLIRNVPERDLYRHGAGDDPHMTQLHGNRDRRASRMITKQEHEVAQARQATPRGDRSEYTQRRAEAKRFPGDRAAQLLEGEVTWTLKLLPPDRDEWIEFHLQDTHILDSTKKIDRLLWQMRIRPPRIMDRRVPFEQWREFINGFVEDSETEIIPYEFSKLADVERVVRDFVKRMALSARLSAPDEQGRVPCGIGSGYWVPHGEIDGERSHFLIKKTDLLEYFRRQRRGERLPDGVNLHLAFDLLGFVGTRPRDGDATRTRYFRWDVRDMYYAEQIQRILSGDASDSKIVNAKQHLL
jgi:hypothetical protein